MIDKIGDAITLAGATINPVVNNYYPFKHLDRFHNPCDFLLEGEGRPACYFKRKDIVTSLSCDHYCGLNYVSGTVYIQ
jgi:hypothetical protein